MPTIKLFLSKLLTFCSSIAEFTTEHLRGLLIQQITPSTDRGHCLWFDLKRRIQGHFFWKFFGGRSVICSFRSCERTVITRTYTVRRLYPCKLMNKIPYCSWCNCRTELGRPLDASPAPPAPLPARGAASAPPFQVDGDLHAPTRAVTVAAAAAAAPQPRRVGCAAGRPGPGPNAGAGAQPANSPHCRQSRYSESG